jgi:hypothetical protein
MEQLILQEDTIAAHIFEIRGQKVMMDADLAQIYGVETKVLNQAVKRNAQRFPADFMFQLTEEEWQNLKSQNVTSSWGGRRKLPYVFTEHGTVMLASVLNSTVAIEASLFVVRAFIQMRTFMHVSVELARKIQELEEKCDDRFAIVFDTLRQLTETPAPPREKIGFAINGVP